ncbi:MAG: crossover junction endodeoxyribonuclease RuvC [Candidatus Pacebacteria bacterium]|nr:crossover junction endodeoxyribonuclease RuvC [Candidatus Paceibacterota bacterium]
MKVLAIDPGYERLGIAVIEKENRGKEKLLFSECFQTKAAFAFPERLRQIGEEIEKIIKEYKPKFFAIEKLFFNKNQKTAMLVSECYGAILQIAAQNKLTIREFTPAEIKVATTGSGRADKRQIIQMLPKLLEIKKEIRHDDEYDAIAVGLTFLAVYRP